jgi:hypothetical protein
MIDQLGRPSALGIQGCNLFVGSEPRGDEEFQPLMIVSLDGFEARPVELDVRSTNSINVDPQGRLFVGTYESAEGGRLHTLVLDIESLNVIRDMEGFVLSDSDMFSSDGKYAASIYPGGQRIGSDGVVRTWLGGVHVRSLIDGTWVSETRLIDNKGLRPPWQVNGPLVYLRSKDGILEVYDRDSGKMTSNLDLADTGLIPLQSDPTVFGNKDQKVAMAMASSAQEGWVLVFDLSSLDEEGRIDVGPLTTRVVIAR